eukprot:TRINITY_DN30876_c0_g2_i3.p1 TRINITY_DN30876_c0_g2~~TRINITY_DN30876_c0_g2_i3.p1  ORF type:complete len:230 (+),score=57.15 TRINITY_DN30876_c0_g2_i3:180-869(+)
MQGGVLRTLKLNILSANLTHDTETFGKMDPYCLVIAGQKEVKTKTATDAGRYPIWGDQFTLDLPNEVSFLTFRCYDKDDLSADDFIGEVSLPVSSISPDAVEQRLPLSYKGKGAGELIVITDLDIKRAGGFDFPSATGWQPPVGISKETVRAQSDKVFANYDRDRSGFLDAREFYSALTDLFRALNYPPPGQAEADWALNSFDKNRDGRIAYAEFLQLVHILFLSLIHI